MSYSLRAVTSIITSQIDEKVIFFGYEWISTALITVLSATYFLLLVFTLPFLTGIADNAGNKKIFMRLKMGFLPVKIT